MKFFPALLALAVIGGPVVAKPRTPYWMTVANAAVATCWIVNGIDTKENVLATMNKILREDGISVVQAARIAKLPGFSEDIDDVIIESGGCGNLIPPQDTAPALKTYAL